MVELLASVQSSLHGLVYSSVALMIYENTGGSDLLM